MAENAILFAKPGAVRPSDKGALRKAGIIVVEVENLDDVKLVRPSVDGGSQLPSGELLRAFAIAISTDGTSDYTKRAFAAAVSAAIISRDQS
jgi:hypothetical protein